MRGIQDWWARVDWVSGEENRAERWLRGGIFALVPTLLGGAFVLIAARASLPAAAVVILVLELAVMAALAGGVVALTSYLRVRMRALRRELVPVSALDHTQRAARAVAATADAHWSNAPQLEMGCVRAVLDACHATLAKHYDPRFNVCCLSWNADSGFQRVGRVGHPMNSTTRKACPDLNDDSVARRAIDLRRTQYVRDVSPTDSGYASPRITEPRGSLVCAPVVFDFSEPAVAVAVLCARSNATDAFSEEDIRLVKHYARMLVPVYTILERLAPQAARHTRPLGRSTSLQFLIGSEQLYGVAADIVRALRAHDVVRTSDFRVSGRQHEDLDVQFAYIQMLADQLGRSRATCRRAVSAGDAEECQALIRLSRPLLELPKGAVDMRCFRANPLTVDALITPWATLLMFARERLALVIEDRAVAHHLTTWYDGATGGGFQPIHSLANLEGWCASRSKPRVRV